MIYYSKLAIKHKLIFNAIRLVIINVHERRITMVATLPTIMIQISLFELTFTVTWSNVTVQPSSFIYLHIFFTVWQTLAMIVQLSTLQQCHDNYCITLKDNW